MKRTTIVQASALSTALAEAKTIPKVKKVSDQIRLTKEALVAAGYGRDAVIAVAELWIEADRKLGRMLKATDFSKGGRPKKNQSQAAIGLKLDDFGIKPDKSARTQKLAAVPPPAVAAFIDQCIADDKIDPTPGTLMRLLGRAEAKAKADEIAAQPTRPEDGTYDVLVIDPPWDMKKIEREVAPDQHEFDYPTMTKDELMDVGTWFGQPELPAADNAHVWVWTTHKFLPSALALIGEWGFRYVCTFVWHKPGGFQVYGLPQYNCEFAIYARKGSPKFVDLKAFKVCFDAPRGDHSEKPEAFYDLLRRVTTGHRLDIFGRREIEGFKSWGNESD